MEKFSVIVSGEVVISARSADEAEQMVRNAIQELRHVAGLVFYTDIPRVEKGERSILDVAEALEVSGSDILSEDEIVAP